MGLGDCSAVRLYALVHYRLMDHSRYGVDLAEIAMVFCNGVVSDICWLWLFIFVLGRLYHCFSGLKSHV